MCSVPLFHTGAFLESGWQNQFWTPGKQKYDLPSRNKLGMNMSPKSFCPTTAHWEWPYAKVTGLWSMQSYGGETCEAKLGKHVGFSKWISLGWGAPGCACLYSVYHNCNQHRELASNRDKCGVFSPLPCTVTFWYSPPTPLPLTL